MISGVKRSPQSLCFFTKEKMDFVEHSTKREAFISHLWRLGSGEYLMSSKAKVHLGIFHKIFKKNTLNEKFRRAPEEKAPEVLGKLMTFYSIRDFHGKIHSSKNAKVLTFLAICQKHIHHLKSWLASHHRHFLWVYEKFLGDVLTFVSNDILS